MATVRLTLECGPPMKPTKGTPPAKGRTTAKVTPVTQGSKNLKTTPSAKNLPAAKAAPTRKSKPVKVLPLDTSAPRDSAAPPVPHSAKEVAARAYLNYLKRGASEGNHTDDWLQAEAELTAERRLVHP